jgi:hypothetical protein
VTPRAVKRVVDRAAEIASRDRASWMNHDFADVAHIPLAV